MNAMSEAELAAEVAKMVRALGKEPHPDLMSIYVKILRDDMEIRLRYVASLPLRRTVPITAFGWTDDEEVRHDRMANWADCGDTRFEFLSGDHNRFSDAPAEMLDVICADMKG
jgi:surfactin synthase thioesterase subunit